MSKKKLMSWGRYPNYPQTAHALSDRNDISPKLSQLKQTLAFGNGRSYGDSCLAASDHVLHTQFLDRFISADWQTGIIQAEAGVTLQDILQLAIPKGWFLPVSPGTQYVTLGGAIANDVHGKNHHVRGTLGCHIKQLNLVRSDRPVMTCSLTENPEMFAATIGGLGLTGVIAWAQIQLMPIASSLMDTVSIRFDTLDDFFALSQALDQKYEYTVAWVDCLAKDASLGRGIFSAANHAPEGLLQVSVHKKITIPFAPPISFVNRYSLKLFNYWYYQQHKNIRQEKLIPYEPFFYPLDRILQWNLLYGHEGFQQYQCVIPQSCAQDVMRELLSAITQSGHGSFLAVMKQCGAKSSPGLMSFPMEGVSLALDFPQQQALKPLFVQLDKIVHEAGGRLYPAKDAHMSGEDFQRAYPKWAQVERLRDPALCSRFWQRVLM